MLLAQFSLHACLKRERSHDGIFVHLYSLVWCSIHVILGIPTLDYYLPSREAPNVLRLDCVGDNGVPPMQDSIFITLAVCY